MEPTEPTRTFRDRHDERRRLPAWLVPGALGVLSLACVLQLAIWGWENGLNLTDYAVGDDGRGFLAERESRPICKEAGCNLPVTSRTPFEEARKANIDIPDWGGQHDYCDEHNRFVCAKCEKQYRLLPSSTRQCTTCLGFVTRKP